MNADVFSFVSCCFFHYSRVCIPEVRMIGPRAASAAPGRENVIMSVCVN